jgi:hypothetical protein
MVMLPSIFRYKYGGPDFPEWEVPSYECVSFVTVHFTEQHQTYSREKLLESMLHKIKNGKAKVTYESPIDRHATYRISIPVYGPEEAPEPVIVATVREVAEARLAEI